MNRREFLQRAIAFGLILPSTKVIFDLAANSYRVSREWEWIPNPQSWHDPFQRIGSFYYKSDIMISNITKPNDILYCRRQYGF